MKTYKDIEKTINRFKATTAPEDRYTSFDYSYNYFLKTNQSLLLQDMEKSCLALGFYLASWGMLRGSTFLSRKSVKHFVPTIEFIASLDKKIWRIDANCYDEQNIACIIDVYDGIRENLLPDAHTPLTLITKVMLGVFGFVPAYDEYFCKTFREISGGPCRFRSFNKNSLRIIKDFYDANNTVIDKLSKSTYTTDFATGKKTRTTYPRAKIIDMYGFTLGLNR